MKIYNASKIANLIILQAFKILKPNSMPLGTILTNVFKSK